MRKMITKALLERINSFDIEMKLFWDGAEPDVYFSCSDEIIIPTVLLQQMLDKAAEYVFEKEQQSLFNINHHMTNVLRMHLRNGDATFKDEELVSEFFDTEGDSVTVEEGEIKLTKILNQ